MRGGTMTGSRRRPRPPSRPAPSGTAARVADVRGWGRPRRPAPRRTSAWPSPGRSRCRPSQRASSSADGFSAVARPPLPDPEPVPRLPRRREPVPAGGRVGRGIVALRGRGLSDIGLVVGAGVARVAGGGARRASGRGLPGPGRRDGDVCGEPSTWCRRHSRLRRRRWWSCRSWRPRRPRRAALGEPVRADRSRSLRQQGPRRRPARRMRRAVAPLRHARGRRGGGARRSGEGAVSRRGISLGLRGSRFRLVRTRLHGRGTRRRPRSWPPSPR